VLHVTISKKTALIVVAAALLTIPGAAVATHVFTDVGDSNVHAPAIEWAASSGVTAGCGDGTSYCPGDPVTRAQMATFLHRMSGQAAGVAPSVDADLLDGLDSSSFLGATDTATDADLLDGLDSSSFLGATDTATDADLLDGLDSSSFLGATDTAADADRVDGRHANELTRLAFAEAAVPMNVPGFLATTIDVPIDGFLLMSASANLVDGIDPGPFPVECSLMLDGFGLPASIRVVDMGTSVFDEEETCATDAIAFVPVGLHNVDFAVNLGSGVTQFGPATVWVLFVPFDGLGS